uniref:Uncharacterized protein n=1 Tax=Ditylenchus dipsaci TaxID=166011 RepID=A0A915DW18_9BILA
MAQVGQCAVPTVVCSIVVKSGWANLNTIAMLRVSRDDQWMDDPLDVQRHCCGLQPFKRTNMRSPAVDNAAISPTTSFGEVTWGKSKFNSLSPYISIAGQEEPLRFVVSNRASDGRINIKCNRCVIHTVRNRKSGVKGMPMFCSPSRITSGSTAIHCPPPGIVVDLICPRPRSAVKNLTRSAPHVPQPNRSRKLSFNKSLPSVVADSVPNFGDVQWTLGKRGGRVAAIALPHLVEPAHFCISAANQGIQSFIILKCSWCMTLSSRSRAHGKGPLKVVNFKVLNDQWVMHNPQYVKNHCCKLQPPYL